MKEALRKATPTLVSATSMFLALLSCLLSATGQLEAAAWVIVYCGFLDKLDGIVARALRVSSPFGMEMDSFSDFTAFGVAPAALSWFSNSPSSGLEALFVALGSFSFPLLAAIRLARFNLVTHADKECFIGVPTTFAGLWVATLFLVLREFECHCDLLIPALMPGIGALMVTGLRIPKLKARSSRAFNIFQLAVALVILVLSILQKFPIFPLIVGIAYLIIGSIVGRRMVPIDEAKRG